MKHILGVLCLLVMAGCASKEHRSEAADRISDSDYIESPSSDNSQNSSAGTVTAGELNDLQNWKDWKKSSRTFQDEALIDVSNRISVKVLSKKRQPLSNIEVRIYSKQQKQLWKTVTDNQGMAELFVEDQIQKKDLVLRVEDKEYSSVKFIEEGENLIISNTDNNGSEKVEIAFVMDATGSMGDELEFLKTEVQDVVKRAEKNLDMEVLTASVFYRDQGDEYVARVNDFSEDVDETHDFISNQYAAGGGDFPEAVDEALDKTIHELDWSKKSFARLVFLILDAPPHDDPNTTQNIKELITSASANGIKIIPVVASGIDKDTEFLMRQFAISTNGTYVFITDDSGVGNSHLEPTTKEDYQVHKLNDLMVELIVRYCAKSNT